MSAVWKGSVCIGTLHIPVKLYHVAVEGKSGFHYLHDSCKNKINLKKICTVCNEELSTADVIRGYNYEGDKIIAFSEDEFKEINMEKDSDIKILKFTDFWDVNDAFYEKSYYVVPDGEEELFDSFKKALNETGKCGIAKVVLNKEDVPVVLRYNNERLFLSTLYYKEDLQDDPCWYTHKPVNQNETEIFKQVIFLMNGPFQPDEFHSEYKERLQRAVDRKLNEGKA